MVDTAKVMRRIQAYMETAAPVKAKKKPRLVRHRKPLGKWANKPVNRTSKVPKPTKLFSKTGTKKPVAKKPAAPALTADQKMRWSKMSRAKQEQYLDKHPNSQFKKLGLNKAVKPTVGKGGVAKPGTAKPAAGAPAKKAPAKRAAARPKTDKEKARAKRRVAALGRGGIKPGSKERAESALAIERDGPNVLKETLSEKEVQELGEDVDSLREGRELPRARRGNMARIVGGLAVAALLVAGLSTISPGLAMVVGSQLMEKLPDYMSMFTDRSEAAEETEQSDTDASIGLLTKAVAQYVHDEEFPDDMLSRLAEEADAGGEEEDAE